MDIRQNLKKQWYFRWFTNSAAGSANLSEFRPSISTSTRAPRRDSNPQPSDRQFEIKFCKYLWINALYLSKKNLWSQPKYNRAPIGHFWCMFWYNPSAYGIHLFETGLSLRFCAISTAMEIYCKLENHTLSWGCWSISYTNLFSELSGLICDGSQIRSQV